jgi:transcriptional regulator with PAS, ATPase and Fis domain
MDLVHRLPTGSRSNVLIDGETGTGKELLAHAIHETSGGATEPFVAISCGAIPRELIESELFGYDPGAFTGARREGKLGAFERAGSGTILLDEIGEMDLDMQVRLLRVLEAREFSRVGGQDLVRMKARVIAATNRDLKREVDGGKFRADLFFRLNVVPMTLPPLRERGGDVVLLAETFLNEFNPSMGKSFKGISPAAQDMLLGHTWPGNVRELRNTMERIVSLETGDEVTAEHLAMCLPDASPRPLREGVRGRGENAPSWRPPPPSRGEGATTQRPAACRVV